MLFDQCLLILLAIRVEENITSVADSLDLESMTIEGKYDGPRLQDDKIVTKEFMEKLLEHYKDRKLLHRRYAFQILVDIRQYFMSQPTLGNNKEYYKQYLLSFYLRDHNS